MISLNIFDVILKRSGKRNTWERERTHTPRQHTHIHNSSPMLSHCGQRKCKPSSGASIGIPANLLQLSRSERYITFYAKRDILPHQHHPIMSVKRQEMKYELYVVDQCGRFVIAFRSESICLWLIYVMKL